MLRIFLFFFKVGSISFGKMVATSNMFQEYVENRRVLSKEDFFTLNGFLRLFPGPTQSQMSIALGSMEHGIFGGILGGLGYLLPSFTLITLGAYLYFEQQSLLPIEELFYGINIISLSLLCYSVYKMISKSIQSWLDGFITLLSLIMTFFNIQLLGIFAVAAVCSFIYHGGIKKIVATLKSRFHSIEPISMTFLFFFFLKIGFFIYGGGLVMIPLIKNTMIDTFGWMNSNDFLAGFALGQSTPGPVILTVAFFGYKVAMLAGIPGFLGASIAAIGIMLPSFALILTLGRFFSKLNQMPLLSKILQSFMPAAIGSILAGAPSLFTPILTTPSSWIIMIGAALLLFLNWSPILLVVISGFLGFIPWIK
ncbi:MAG: chromate efflux transporter [Brevinema sp.]